MPRVLFGVPWTAFAVFWTASASGFKMPELAEGRGLFALFGIPFILVGFFMLASPVFAARSARYSAYVLTSERALILETGLLGRISIRSFLPHQLSSIQRVQFQDGSGDLIFERKSVNDGESSHRVEVGFFGIPDVRSVEEIVLGLAKSGSK